MIDELNTEVVCRLAPSPLHGIGVFTLKDIKKGEKLYCLFNPHPMYDVPYVDFSELRPEVRDLILDRYPGVIHNQKFLSPNDDQILTSFMNHADTPNYDSEHDCALVDIPQGTEVTEDYRLMPNFAQAYAWLK